MSKDENKQQYRIEEFVIKQQPFYVPSSDEVEIFEAAYRQRVPVLLKGPTGTGKTRFVEYMAWKLGQPLTIVKDSAKGDAQDSNGAVPLVTVACHEDLSASDLIGRYLLDATGTRWIDGPLTRAVREGAICYLDEIVEARQDTTVVIHPLTDDRRILPVEKTGETLVAPDEFMLVISFNPGYQSLLKDLKASTKQRFIGLEFDYPDPEMEAEIVVHESGVDEGTARALVLLGGKIRNLKDKGLEETASTRLLVYAGQLIGEGVPAQRACEIAMLTPITDEPEVKRGIRELITSVF